MANVPTRTKKTAGAGFEEVAAAPAKKFDLSGKYRVREGYSVAHGAREGDADGVVGRHSLAKPGEIIALSHEDALAVIRLTKDQKDAEGRPNGPAIETEEAYKSRIAAARAQEEFAQALADANAAL